MLKYMLGLIFLTSSSQNPMQWLCEVKLRNLDASYMGVRCYYDLNVRLVSDQKVLADELVVS